MLSCVGTTGSACGWHGGTWSLSNTLAFVSVPQAGSQGDTGVPVGSRGAMAM